jgi:hypothetical protein
VSTVAARRGDCRRRAGAGPAAEQEAPAVLPFADDADSDDALAASDAGAPCPVASASDGVGGIYTALLALVFAVLLGAFLYLVGRVVAQRRPLA